LFGACSTMEVITSSAVSAENPREVFSYDGESQIRYRVYNDRDTMHLKFVCSDRTTMAKVLRHGTKVYFDLKGKKKKDTYVFFPLPAEMPARMQQRQDLNIAPDGRPVLTPDRSQARFRDMQSGGVSRVQPDPGKMLQRIPREIRFVQGKEEELIRPSPTLPSDIRCKLSMNRSRALVYELSIPFSRIAESGLASISVLSIGIETEDRDIQAAMNRSGGMGGRSGMSGMGGPGGRQGMGGGRSPGMSGARPGASAQSRINMEELATPLKLWFQVDLNRD